MKPTQEETLKWFDTLIEKGEAILRSCNTSLTGDPIPRNDDYLSFRTQAINLVRRVCGEDSSHYAELHRLATESESANHSAFFPHCLGVVEAARSDVEMGLLSDVADKVMVDVILALVESARRRRASEALRAAAVLGGAAVELTLAAMCEARSITRDATAGPGAANDVLAADGAYSAAVQQRVAGLLDVSDRGADPAAPEPNAAEVDDLVEWVPKLVADHLG